MTDSRSTLDDEVDDEPIEDSRETCGFWDSRAGECCPGAALTIAEPCPDCPEASTATPFRILVTGSRDWLDWQAVCRELAKAAEGVPGGSVVLVSGGARGADHAAEAYAGAMDWGIEVHPGDWATHGRAAGPKRNAEMIAAGADVCLAFIRNGSRGATHCADLAEAFGIPVRRFLA